MKHSGSENVLYSGTGGLPLFHGRLASLTLAGEQFPVRLNEQPEACVIPVVSHNTIAGPPFRFQGPVMGEALSRQICTSGIARAGAILNSYRKQMESARWWASAYPAGPSFQ